MIQTMPIFTSMFSPSRCGFNVVANSSMAISDVNNAQTVNLYAGDGFEVRYYFKVIERMQALALRNILLKLRGHQHTLRCLDSTYRYELGFLGNPVVNGSGQYGYALNVRGLLPDALVAKANERFVLNGQLHELLEDVNSDNLGQATLVLASEIRTPTTDGDTLNTDVANLYATCRWRDPAQIKQFEGTHRLYRNITLDFLEAR